MQKEIDMEEIGNDLVTLLNFLLPGLLSAWMFYGLTPYQRPSQFGKIIQALIFTFIIHSVLSAFKLIHSGISNFANENHLFSLAMIAVFIGAFSSFLANSDRAHALFRWAQITSETSYPSEWFGAFLKRQGYIVLHFKDGRRLYGFPIETPSDPSKGHFVLTFPSWQAEEGKIKLQDVEKMLVQVEDVKWVEFIYEQNPRS
jgi:hypothetical protein